MSGGQRFRLLPIAGTSPRLWLGFWGKLEGKTLKSILILPVSQTSLDPFPFLVFLYLQEHYLDGHYWLHFTELETVAQRD